MTHQIDKTVEVFSSLGEIRDRAPDGTWSLRAKGTPLPELLPVSKVLPDYLVLGLFVESKEARLAAVESAKTDTLRWGRYRVESQAIYLDERRVGYITGSRGTASKYGYKVKVFFTGVFFRPVELGGCGLSEREAARVAWVWAMSLKYGLPVVQALVELQTAEQRYKETGLGIHAGRVGRAHAQVRHLEAKCGEGPVPDFDVRFVSIDRVDYAVEVKSNDSRYKYNLPLRWYEYGKRGVDMIFSGFKYARTKIESYKGVTVYCGTSEDPLKQRGKTPLLRVYQYSKPHYTSRPQNESSELRREHEEARAHVVRLEVEHPRVIHVSHEDLKGGIRAAEKAAELLGEALGFRGQSLPVARRENAPKGLYVPIMDIENVWGKNEVRASFVTEGTYYGHAADESRRIGKSGMTCLRNQLLASLLVGAADCLEKQDDIPYIPVLSEPPITEDEADAMIDLLMVYRHWKFGRKDSIRDMEDLVQVLQEEGFGSLLPPYVSGGICAKGKGEGAELVESSRELLMCNDGLRIRPHRRELLMHSMQIDQITHIVKKRFKAYLEDEIPELSR